MEHTEMTFHGMICVLVAAIFASSVAAAPDTAQPDKPPPADCANFSKQADADFGAINIDAELVDGVEENTISLTNGCVCCEIRDDLVNSLEQLLTREDAIEYVILEAKGVADPEGIVMTFLDQRYERLLRLDSTTCIDLPLQRDYLNQ